MPQPDIKQLFEAGAHFGHKTSRWNPKMAGYIHSKRGDSHIINLEKTVEQLEKALPFITEVVLAEADSILRDGAPDTVPFFDNSGPQSLFRRLG